LQLLHRRRQLLGRVGGAEAHLLGDLEPSAFRSHLEPFEPRVTVRVVVPGEAHGLALAAALGHVPGHGVDGLHLVRRTDGDEVRLAHPEGVERRGRSDDAVALEVGQQPVIDLGAQQLREHRHLVLDGGVLRGRGVGDELAVDHDELDRVLTGDAPLGIERVEEHAVAVGQRKADH
jgi:hypothetical protein